MDGAPYLRKVDLKMYRSYPELSMALEKMFSSFTSGKCVVAALTTMRSIQITGVDMSSSSCLSGNHNHQERWRSARVEAEESKAVISARS
ncbi:hypothetical protein B296_00005045 [Ensete ventricosum]|uniref:Auxin-responsive protein n=1 Tax=Ensete ventricosum TaxID=4639 RepID=A0A427BA60_ENSVE|nr:hypothetical protein B296_00005045 [Ensete ventricosum]